MVELTRLNDTTIAINPFQIEYMEETPDTIIVMSSGRKMVVKEKVVEIEDKFADFLSKSIRKGLQKTREG
jgi:flagellar protein FlbD